MLLLWLYIHSCFTLSVAVANVSINRHKTRPEGSVPLNAVQNWVPFEYREQIWDIPEDVIHSDLGLLESDCEQLNEGYHLLSHGKFAAAKPILIKAIDNWKAAVELLKVEGRNWIARRVERALVLNALGLPDEGKLSIVEELFYKTLWDLHKDLEKMKEALAEVQRGLAFQLF